MATFGKTSDGASSTSDSADTKWASSASPASTGVVTSLTHRIWLSGAGTGTFRGFIYSDNAGAPDALLAVTDDTNFTNTTEQEVTANFTGVNQITITSGTTYWIGVHWQDPGAINVVLSRDATANLRVSQAEAFADGTSNPFGTPTTLSGPIDCYVTYIETSIKTVNGLAEASVKTVNGLANASVKTIKGLA